MATLRLVYKILLALHLLTAVFAIGPLAHAVTTASRGLRTSDGAATATAARTTRIYAYASVVVVVIGFGLMSAESPYTGDKVAGFGELWIWLSALLWLVAVALALGIVVPALERATAAIGNGDAVDGLVGRVAASGGVIGLLFAVIVFLMVYQPGS